MAEFVVIEDQLTHWTAIGTREQLIAEGLCTPANFPAGRRRFSHGKCGDGRDPGHWWSMARIKGGKWLLRVNRNQEEIDANHAANVRRRRAQMELEDLPRTAEEWRSGRLNFVNRHLDALLDKLSPSDGFAFVGGNPEVSALIRRLRMVLANAPITVDDAAHKARIHALEIAAGTPLEAVCGLRAPLRLVA